ncbi:hypothetical protein BG015_008669 [Linnemannia schmuckeri]|uniref:Uncharacterized protein n=1 Tax=Linnemannia schmuckeri TaxID=64567 RepID=A0A9P5VA51_9FUNG|nr:hypothetical protein BG015_008669 [Linnemannia schmuckeri]
MARGSNLCYGLARLHGKCNKYSPQFVVSFVTTLGLLFYKRCMFGVDEAVPNHSAPELIERAFGRIKIIQSHAITVMDEPFVSKAVENYFFGKNLYF